MQSEGGREGGRQAGSEALFPVEHDQRAGHPFPEPRESSSFTQTTGSKEEVLSSRQAGTTRYPLRTVHPHHLTQIQ